MESSPGLTKDEQEPSPAASEAQEQLAPAAAAFEVEELGWGTQLAVKLRMLVAPPWQHVRKGSVLNMKLRGEVIASACTARSTCRLCSPLMRFDHFVHPEGLRNVCLSLLGPVWVHCDYNNQLK